MKDLHRYSEKCECCVCNILRLTVQRFGDTHQKIKLIEECSELSAAMARHLNCRAFIHKKRTDDVLGEIADVQILLMQMEVIFGRQRIDEIRAEKLLRLSKLIEEGEKS